VPDYGNVLVKVAVILGVLNRVPAAIPEHNVFCYSTVAHILTPSVNLVFGPNRASKINIGSSRVRACDFGLLPGSGLKMRPFYNSAWVGMYAGANKGRLNGCILHPPTVNID